METISEAKLKVGELTERGDFGRGIARISARDMRRIGVNEGDVIEIEGKRRTVGIIVRSYPADVGLDIVRMDGLMRRNCGASISEVVNVKRCDVKEAKFVTIAPARKGIIIHMSPELMKRNLLMRPVNVGDVIVPNPVVKSRQTGMQDDVFGDVVENMFASFGINLGGSFSGFGEEKFVIVSTDPKGPVRITGVTEVELLPQATDVEEQTIPDVTYEDLGGLHEEIKLVREMVELPLKHPELFERLGIEPPKGVLLHGSPGCGKTLLAKAVASESGARFFVLNGPEIMSKWYGQSEENLRNIFDQAQKSAPSIIFIDEIDSIAPKREEVKGEVEKRVVSQLLTLLDGLKSRGKIIVIGATNIPNAIDPALRRPGRLDREIEIGVPDKFGRKEILQIHTRGMPIEPVYDKENTRNVIGQRISALKDDLDNLNKKSVDNGVKDEIKNKKIEQEKLTKVLQKLQNLSEKEFPETMVESKESSFTDDERHTIKTMLNAELLNKIAEITYGYVGADISALAKEAAMHTLRRVLPDISSIKEDKPLPPEILKKLVVSDEDFKHALKMVQPSGMREVMIEIPNVKWTDVGGLNDVKQSLAEAIEWPMKQPKAFERMGIRPPKGVMLFGPPGCGKTLMAKAVANESGANFIYVKAGELLSMYVGESEKHVREIFRRAKQVAPAIIFFDEIDAMTPKRGMSGQDSHVTERVVSQMLAEMSGLEEMKDVMVLAATNRPDMLDTALLRPGRFDRHILVPTPDRGARVEIFKIHTKSMPIEGVNVEELADKTDGYSGADIEAVCREAAIAALRKNIEADRVTDKDFEKALDEVKPSVDETMNTFYQSVLKRRKQQKPVEEDVEYIR